jgi:hypothetical protein
MAAMVPFPWLRVTTVHTRAAGTPDTGIGRTEVAPPAASDGQAPAYARVQPARIEEHTAAHHDSDPDTPLNGPTSSGVTQPP